MTAPLDLFAPEPSVRTTRASDAVLASLPLSYTPAPSSGAGGVVVVDGSAGWSAAVVQALDNGAVGVIVTQPRPEDLGELHAVAAPHGVVVVDSTWASNPVLPAASKAIRTAIGPRSRLECRIVVRVGTDLDRALLDQLSLLRALIGPVVELEILQRSEHGYVGEGHADAVAVDLSVVCTNATPEHATVRLLTSDGSIEVEIPSGETAQPAHLTIISANGAQIAPTLYESGHRATWRRLHRLVTSGETANDLDGLRTDIATTAQHRHDRS